MSNTTTTLTNKNTTSNYSFNVRHEGKEYEVTIYTNDNGKFIDEVITHNGEHLEYEGEEGQIRGDIITFIDENWDSIV